MKDEYMAAGLDAFIGPPEARRDFFPLLRLLLFNAIAFAGLVALWYFGFLDLVLNSDHTRISLAIFIITLATTIHCFYQTGAISRERVLARRIKQTLLTKGKLAITPEGTVTAGGTPLPPSLFTGHIASILRKSQGQGGGGVDQSLLLRLLADRLRGRERLGLFVSEALLRLALLGTAIGFILMLLPISALTSFEADVLRGALGGMTNGMAIALNVTVTGIAGALLLKLDYFLLDMAIMDLFDTIAETSEIHVIPALGQKADARA
jgi:hypothetical protein